MSDGGPNLEVDLVVNCYERTYEKVLAPGAFAAIEADNRIGFAGRYAVINNVDDRNHAQVLAEALVTSGELTGYVFVADALEASLQQVGLKRRHLGVRPYFMDFAAVMVTTGSSPFILGWDAEVRLASPANWVSPGLELLARRADVLTVSPRWPARSWDSLPDETVASDGPWALTWGFSDQVWLNRRADLAAPIYRKITPASLGRHASHPFTFEGRVESHQRWRKRYKAVHRTIEYTHNDLPPVLGRLDDSPKWERARGKVLSRLHRALLRVDSQHPTLRVP